MSEKGDLVTQLLKYRELPLIIDLSPEIQLNAKRQARNQPRIGNESSRARGEAASICSVPSMSADQIPKRGIEIPHVISQELKLTMNFGKRDVLKSPSDDTRGCPCFVVRTRLCSAFSRMSCRITRQAIKSVLGSQVRIQACSMMSIYQTDPVDPILMS